MIRALLIDLDGTLVDSAPELALAVNEVRAAHGLEPAYLEQVRHWVGEGVAVLLSNALHELADAVPSDPVLDEARRQFDRAYGRVLGTLADPCAGVVAGLERLRASKLPLACLTNKPERFAGDLLAALDLLAPFQVVVGGDSTAARKPDPEPARFAARNLGVAVAECLVIGDSAIDVATARNAGCRVWCLRSGYSRGESVDELGADAVFDRFDQAVDALVTVEED